MTTVQDWALFLGWLAVLAGVVVAMVRLHRRERHQVAPGRVYDTPEEVVTMSRALTAWLHSEKVVKALVRTKTASSDELQVTLWAIPAMTLPQLQSTACALLRDKDVRRVIADFEIETWHRGRATPETLRLQRQEVLRTLLEWAEPTPQRRSM